MELDIEGHMEKMWLYISEGEKEYDIILGRPWMSKNNVQIAPAQASILIGISNLKITSKESLPPLPIKGTSAQGFQALIHRNKRLFNDARIFAASMADIEKALAVKQQVDPRTKLPRSLQDLYHHFLKEEADKLPPHRGPGIDLAIEIKEKEGKPQEIPWGPLYSMTQEELLVLRKELTSYLDRGFIRVSRSSAAAPVLLAHKPGGGLRFCVDYRALNAITQKDRYPIPLIKETLSQIGKAKWYTKLDVIQAFHKIRIAKGDEWKTAFRTRFGLFEWLVTPFGLANAPANFQRYINWVLREHIDDFCSAFIDDVLVYSSGSLKEHEAKVRQVIEKLGAAGLQLDIKKCEFGTKRVKYLGFIIEAEKGISMDPEKTKAIQDWEPPKTVKGVRSFIGFANFYRQFISNFSEIAAPLTKLTGKNTEFHWGKEQQQAFKALKEIFITEPVLAHFDPELETVLEVDASGWATGGTLSQYDKNGTLRTVAYFSAKNTPAESNYTIHDKELLAVIKCVEEWNSELRAVPHVRVFTDHRNLQYFTASRQLSERHVRWSDILSRINMTFEYRTGNANGRADALSRREQDVPQDNSDERVKSRTFQLLKPIGNNKFKISLAPVMRTLTSRIENEETDLNTLWENAEQEDETYQLAQKAIKEGSRKFPPDLKLKVSLSECKINEKGRLCFRNREWVPNSEPLRTKLVSEMHNSPLTGHPGRTVTYNILSRNYFWPGMSNTIRTFLKNCDVCGRTKSWRELKQGFLKPLPLPEQIWKEISMDFIVGLPESNGCTNLMVVTDRLSKGTILIPLKDIDAESTADAFIERVVAYHFLPNAIVSDRGSQFVGDFWATLCKKLRISRRLSTAFHPQTDGSTERMNSVVEAYLRAFVNWDQSNWASLCPAAQIAINGRPSASTGFSPFFLLHGYEVEPIDLDEETNAIDRHRANLNPGKAAEAKVRKFKEAFELAQANMAAAQQEQERQANQNRQESPVFKVGDKVWLQYGEQISNGRPSKKLDWKNAKFEVTRIVSPQNVELNTPPGIHPVFHVDRLRLHPSNPLPSQQTDDSQPESIIVDGAPEWAVEEIVAEKCTRRGRGHRKSYEVKWQGYAQTTWEPAAAFQETEALDRWEAFSTDHRLPDGSLPDQFRRPLPQETL